MFTAISLFTFIKNSTFISILPYDTSRVHAILRTNVRTSVYSSYVDSVDEYHLLKKKKLIYL